MRLAAVVLACLAVGACSQSSAAPEGAPLAAPSFTAPPALPQPAPRPPQLHYSFVPAPDAGGRLRGNKVQL